MGEFFNPWRRKIGVLTLLTALVLMVGWVRSLHSREFMFIEFEIPIGERIHVYTSNNKMDILLQRSSGWHFDFGKVDPIVKLDVIEDFWLFNGQNIKEEIVDGVQQVAAGYHVGIYFYAIVIPLMLISLWLLISKPRQPTQTKIINPTIMESADASFVDKS